MNTAKIRKEILAKIRDLQRDLMELDRLDAQYGKKKAENSASATADILAVPDQQFSAGGNDDFNLAKATREAMNSFPAYTAFTKADVLARIKAQYPTADINEMSLASILSKLGKSGGLSVVEQGKGKAPSKYSLPNNLSAQEKQQAAGGDRA